MEKKRKIGRPLKYNEHILELTKDYLENHDHKYGDIVPTVAGLSLVLKVTKSTVYKWATEEKFKEFSDTLDEIQSKQEKTLISGGLMKEFDSAISRLMLSNHGYVQKSERDITTQGEKIQPLMVQFIDGEDTNT
jgi:hypothetical protein